jgi:CubicO group peptidase (beta-lactamase class C family)
MTTLKVEADAGEVGFDAERLSRIDAHFARYVDDGRLPGWLILVSRAGKIVHLSAYGYRDLESRAPLERDTLFRIYSMTKPVTVVAAMMLYEEGAFELKDPVSRFIPAFGAARVYRSGSALKPVTEPAREPMRIWHLLTHTAGLTYGFHHAHPVDALYRAAGFEWGPPGRAGSGCLLRRVGGPASAVSAGRGVELLGGDRCAGPGDRSSLRSDS